MPATPILRPGDPINIPTILIPGQDADNPNTLGDERQLRTIPGPYTPPDIDRDGKPDEADPDDDNDGEADTTDPEPQNPSVPRASSDPPAEDTPSQGAQAVEQVREDYDDFLEKPENATYRDRLNRIKE